MTKIGVLVSDYPCVCSQIQVNLCLVNLHSFCDQVSSIFYFFLIFLWPNGIPYSTYHLPVVLQLYSVLI